MSPRFSSIFILVIGLVANQASAQVAWDDLDYDKALGIFNDSQSRVPETAEMLGVRPGVCWKRNTGERMGSFLTASLYEIDLYFVIGLVSDSHNNYVSQDSSQSLEWYFDPDNLMAYGDGLDELKEKIPLQPAHAILTSMVSVFRGAAHQLRMSNNGYLIGIVTPGSTADFYERREWSMRDVSLVCVYSRVGT